ncbi:terminase TerL endonuclease subunit [Mycobacterium sp. WMMD1722]|uniref:terminase TerL endonuclease subunit n=1 Tax=Mycobacterium sp. WMMD1722 TaxID=3404117 RepID=UPI003BF4D0AB
MTARSGTPRSRPRPDLIPRRQAVSVGKPGPKLAADLTPLPWRPRSVGSRRFQSFAERFIITPKGAGASAPFRVRRWQRELVATVLDDPAVKIALWVLPRGCGKSTLTAALALYHVFGDLPGARAVVVAQDERSALRLLATAARMTALNPELAKRVRPYRDRLVVERTDSQIIALPAEAARIEGEDASLAIMDEIGFCRRDSYESLLHSTGKRETSQLLAIGTPSPPTWREASPMLDLVLEGRTTTSPDFRLVEHGGDITHAVDCPCCWDRIPGIDDLVSREHLRAALPPRSRESEFRRARLAEWVEHDDASFLPAGAWDALSTGEPIPDGSRIVLALDGSFNGDATAVVAATVSATPHFDLVGLWSPPDDSPDWRVPILEVEQTIRDAAKRWRVAELTADPFRWQRSLALLAGEGLPVTEFNQTAARLTPATTDAYQAAINGEMTHSGNADLARHIANATVTEDARGVRLAKEKRHSRRRIDAAVAMVMCHSRATWIHNHRKRKRARSFAS